MLNLGYGLSPGILFITSLLTSWAWSTFLESILWVYLLKRQGVEQRFISVIGWMALIQILSTPLSFGVAMVIYGTMIWVLPMPIYIDIFLQSASLFWNPIGVFIGFFLVPILLEFFLWYQGLRWFRVAMRKTTRFANLRLTPLILLAGVVIANASTFLFIFLISNVYIIFLFVTGIGGPLILFIFGVLCWFLCSNRGVASPWFQENPSESNSPSEETSQ